MASVRARDWALFAFLVLYSFVPIVGGLARVIELTGGPAAIPENPRALVQPLPDIVHILASVTFCFFGALQFLPSLRRQSPRLHRNMGRIVAPAGVVAASTGLWMTHYYSFPAELQGTSLYLVRIILSLAMIGLIIRAVLAIRSRNVAVHRASMIRAYAIGLGASTQALIGIATFAVADSELLGSTRDIMMISAWGINLLFAELIILLVVASSTTAVARKAGA